MAIYGNNKRYTEYHFKIEKDFEDDVFNSAKTLFGKNTIYINAKKKIESKSLGNAIPDGFFFDFNEPNDPQFYIVEVELSRHRFFEHIFPQITRFFAFFKNPKLQKSLVDKLFSVINTDDSIKSEFKYFIGHAEIYKFLSDVIESSQNILLIVDGHISELPDIQETYSDTWGKMVKYLEVKKYTNNGNTIYSVEPDFEILQYKEPGGDEVEEIENEKPNAAITESYHLEGVSLISKQIYNKIRAIALLLNKDLIFNPQKYYISIRAKRNIAFIKVRTKKVRIIVMMPEKEIKKIVHQNTVSSLSQPVQDFYNGPCAAVDFSDKKGLKEIQPLIKRLLEYFKK